MRHKYKHAQSKPTEIVPGKMTVIVLNDVTSLREHIVAWEDLVTASIEPNVFYEPWMLLPALDAFGRDGNIHVMLVYTPNPTHESGPSVLCGMFFLERRFRHKGLPVSYLRLWAHKYCYLCTPLLRRHFELACMEAFFEWLASNPLSCQLIEFGCINGDGPFNHTLTDFLYKYPKLTYMSESYLRAFFVPDHNNQESCLQNVLSGKRRKELRRQEKLLARKGELEYRSLRSDEPVDTWIEEFLRLETKGWKGRKRTAFTSTDVDKVWFTTIMLEAHRRGQLMMLALKLDGKIIAMKCNFLDGEGSFAFKIAFDEEYKAHSPGVHLELYNMKRLQQMPDIAWMDSCAIPNHFMIDRLWNERRSIQTVTVACRGGIWRFYVALIPLLRWFKRLIWRTQA